MCRIAFLAFAKDVTQEQRREALARVAKNGWDLGNRHGVGLATWDDREEALVVKSLQLKEIEDWLALAPADPEYKPVGRYALVHARLSTNTIGIPNTHPLFDAGAYLVHNGVVSTTGPADACRDVERACATDNDSELILRAYLREGRDLLAGLKLVGGRANVMLWDRERGVLSVFADNEDFQVWRQAGVLMMVQQREQTDGLVRSGLGHPYEYAVVRRGRVYELALPGSVRESLAAAAKGARETSVPGRSYQSGGGGRWPGLQAGNYRWVQDGNRGWVREDEARAKAGPTVVASDEGERRAQDGSRYFAPEAAKRDRALSRAFRADRFTGVVCSCGTTWDTADGCVAHASANRTHLQSVWRDGVQDGDPESFARGGR